MGGLEGKKRPSASASASSARVKVGYAPTATLACTIQPTRLVGDVVDHDGGLRSSVVHGRQAVVSLLTRRVPDLKLDRRVIQAHRLGEEGR